MLLLTMKLKLLLTIHQPKITKPMNCLMDKPSLSAHRDLDALRHSSSLWSLVNKCLVSMKSLITQYLSAILILEKTSIATS